MAVDVRGKKARTEPVYHSIVALTFSPSFYFYERPFWAYHRSIVYQDEVV